MEITEKQRIINREIRCLVVAKCDTPTTFSSVISHTHDGLTDFYSAISPYKQYEDNGQYVYEFLYRTKETITCQDGDARALINSLLGVSE